MQNQEEFDNQEMVKALFGVLDTEVESTEEKKSVKEFTSLELTDTGNCPICDNKVRKDYEDYMEYTLSEYRYVCDRCGLTSMFAYGNYETYIEEFGWGDTYNSNQTEAEAEQVLAEQKFVARVYRKMLVDNEDLTSDEDTLLEELAEKIQKRRNGEAV